jgi:hypothetical protein
MSVTRIVKEQACSRNLVSEVAQMQVELTDCVGRTNDALSTASRKDIRLFSMHGALHDLVTSTLALENGEMQSLF